MTDSSRVVLRAEGLGRTYRSGPRPVTVLDNLSVEVSAGESLAIVGESGVGKSTLLQLMGGLDRPDSGELTVDAVDLRRASTEQLGEFRNRSVGFVFQAHHLLPEFTALENVEMPFRIGGRLSGARDRARAVLADLGLESRLDHRPAELSGGEQQRVAIARAVVGGPKLVLADEPTGNLDPGTGAKVFDVLSELQREQGFALVLATHSERLAAGCTRILRLADGGLHPLSEDERESYFRGLGV
ncbi:MAG: ABC transporter ATP-binding protein [Acidobacteriota bacterium]|nr:ABC transporter ATP-binding protein [Acidobacteriota bacterium]MDH3784571.1 ABC transporter ATP-binding protein [Acidobacteriota bacterium]